MAWFVRRCIKGGRCRTLNQYFNSILADEVFNVISTELNIYGNVCETSDKYFGFINKHRKVIEIEYDSHFEDYRDIDQEEKAKHVNHKLMKLTMHQN